MTTFQSHLAAAVVGAVGSVLLLGVAWLAQAALSMPLIEHCIVPILIALMLGGTLGAVVMAVFASAQQEWPGE